MQYFKVRYNCTSEIEVPFGNGGVKLNKQQPQSG